MLNFFKKKDKIKELERRIAALETQKDNIKECNLILSIDGAVLGKVAIDEMNKIQRQAGATLIRI